MPTLTDTIAKIEIQLSRTETTLAELRRKQEDYEAKAKILDKDIVYELGRLGALQNVMADLKQTKPLTVKAVDKPAKPRKKKAAKPRKKLSRKARVLKVLAAKKEPQHYDGIADATGITKRDILPVLSALVKDKESHVVRTAPGMYALLAMKVDKKKGASKTSGKRKK